LTTDVISGGTRLVQIKVLCRRGLTTPKIERMLQQGKRVEITGPLLEKQIRSGQNVLTTYVEWFIDANYVSFLSETFDDLKSTEDEIKSFVEESEKNPKILKDISESIFLGEYRDIDV